MATTRETHFSLPIRFLIVTRSMRKYLPRPCYDDAIHFHAGLSLAGAHGTQGGEGAGS